MIHDGSAVVQQALHHGAALAQIIPYNGLAQFVRPKTGGLQKAFFFGFINSPKHVFYSAPKLAILRIPVLYFWLTSEKQRKTVSIIAINNRPTICMV